MYLDDIPLNYWGVFGAAVVYFIIGCAWYAPFAFGKKREEHQDLGENQEKDKKCCCKVGSYLGEFIISFVIAYVLSLFLQISQAEEIIEGIGVAIWVWIGFIATTHFSSVLWVRKTLSHFFVHAGFMFLGLVAMAVVIMIAGF